MSFVSDELANVLKSVYMMDGIGGKEEDRDSSKKTDKSSGDVSKEKRSRKHKHKKHSKSKDKKKRKKRKHKSRSRTRSQSRSRSRSHSTEKGESLKQCKNRSRSPSSRSKSPMIPDEIEHDFVLEKEKPPGSADGNFVESDPTENELNGTDGTVCLSKVATEEEPKHQVVCESKTSGVEHEEHENAVENVNAEKTVGRIKTDLTLEKEEKDRSRSRSHSVDKVTDSKRKKTPSHSRSRSRPPDVKSCKHNKNRHSRSLSRDRKTKRKSRSLSKSKQSSQKKKSRSRSPSRNKSSKKRSKSRCKEGRSKRSLSKSQSPSCSYSSRSRSRSPRQSKSRSPRRSRSKSPRRSRSRSPRRRRSRSRSCRKSPAFRNFRRFSPPHWKRGAGSFRRRWSRSRSRSRRSHSRRRSSSRRRQSRSRSRGRRSRTRSRSRLRSRRSRSRSRRSRSTSRDKKRKRSRSKSCSYSRDRRRSRSKSRSGSKSKDEALSRDTLPAASVAVTNKVSSLIDKPMASDLSTQQVKVAQRAGGKTIAELTAFCKKLQEEKEIVDNNGAAAAAKTEEDDSQPVAHHPFLVKEKPDITIPPVIFPVGKPLVPTVDPSKPLQEQFPVSCGSRHREKEDVSDGAVVADVDGSAIQLQPKEEVFAPPPAEKFDISELVTKRMNSQRRLESDPNDIEALLTLQEIQMKMQNWCQSNVKPGQFTGELVKNLLPKENLQGGFQAWAKKDMFHNLTPVSGGIGMKLLQKMGWKPGQVIGKRGEGYAEPIALTVKIDRKGLSTGKEKATKKGAPAMFDLQGKHPVSALAEYCSKRKWQLPDYSLVFDQGPAHHKQFLFKVLVNSVEYQPAVVCGNKKQAKAHAAIYALKGLGLIPEDADISAV